MSCHRRSHAAVEISAVSSRTLRCGGRLEREFYADQTLRQVRNVVIPAWYNREGYVYALAKLIAQKCELHVDKPGGKDAPHVFFSAHGLPCVQAASEQPRVRVQHVSCTTIELALRRQKYVTDLGDPYQKQTETTVEFVMSRMRTLGYQNSHTYQLITIRQTSPVCYALP